MIPSTSRPLLLGAALLASVSAARADFSGAFDLGAPGVYDLVSGQTIDLGAWSVEFLTDHESGTGSISTVSAPDSFTLSASVYGAGAAVSVSYDGFTSAGTVNFSAAGPHYQNLNEILRVYLDEDLQSSTDLNYTIDVQPGQVLAITLWAVGFNITSNGGIPSVDHFQADSSVEISNFTFTPAPSSPIPEPASAAALFGAFALSAGALRRRRRA